jgi:hypothetical protein
MPSYIELDKQASFPASSDVSKIILGINTNNVLQITNNNGQSFNASPSYNVYTALLTQSGGSDPLNQGSGAVTKGVTYTVDEYFAGTDFSNVGGGTFASPISPFVATSNDTPTNYNGSTLDYNSGAPVVNVLENTIGNIWWEYNVVGSYIIKSSGLFTTDKTFVITSYGGDGIFTYIIEWLLSDDSNLYLITGEITAGAQDGILTYPSSIEIRVYN